LVAGTATATGFTAVVELLFPADGATVFEDGVCTATTAGFTCTMAFAGTAAGFTATVTDFDVAAGTTFTDVGEGFATVEVCVVALAFTAVCTFFCTTAGFCAIALAPKVNHNEIAKVRFIYVLPLAFAALTAGGGASWLKNVVAVQVATTLSFGAY